MNKTVIGIIVALVVIAGAAFLIYKGPMKDGTDTNESGAQGQVIFSVTDAAANMESISQVNMKISKVEMHSLAGGWVTVSTAPRSYDLLELRDSSESKVLADIRTKAGTYDQVRLWVDSVAVTNKNGSVKTAKLPANEVTIASKVVVNENKTTSVNFDFLADKSLYATDKGEYIFAPVVKTESKSNATVSIGADGVVNIVGGTVDSSNSFGMDIDGAVRLDFMIDTERDLEINSDNVITVEGLLK